MEKDFLYKITDEVWALIDLKADPLYEKIPKVQRKYFINTALSIAVAEAQKYKNQNLIHLMELNGTTINHHSEIPRSGLHSQIYYCGDKKEIDIYDGMINKLFKIMQSTDYPLSESKIAEVFVAHEFYHWLEYSSGISTEQKCNPIQVKTFGLIKRDLHIRMTSEIAAFEFSKIWCDLPVHPKLMDYILFAQESNQSHEAIELLLMRYQQELSEIIQED